LVVKRCLSFFTGRRPLALEWVQYELRLSPSPPTGVPVHQDGAGDEVRGERDAGDNYHVRDEEAFGETVELVEDFDIVLDQGRVGKHHRAQLKAKRVDRDLYQRVPNNE